MDFEDDPMWNYEPGGEPLPADEEQDAWDEVLAERALRVVRPGEAGAADLSFVANDYTDISNAVRFVEHHRQRARYVPNLGWFVWDGRRWAEDVRGQSLKLAMQTCVRMEREAADIVCPDKDQAKALKRAVQATKSVNRMRAMLAAAASMPEMVVTADELDAHPMMLNARNGVIDLATGQLLDLDDDARRELLLTKLVNVDYDPAATCPRFEQFLGEVFLERADLIAYVQRAVGYSLTGSVKDAALFFAYGGGANGKSVFFKLLLALAGDSGITLGADTLLATHGEQHPTHLMDLKGARMAQCAETEEGRRLDEAQVKALTGGERVKARKMRADFVEFEPSHHLWLASNALPVVRGGHAIWRRIKLIPFDATFTEEQQDKGLYDHLVANELPGILAWAVRGAVAWNQQGLGSCAVVDDATGDYRGQMDWLGAFLSETVVDQPESWVLVQTLFDAYRKWALDNGEKVIVSKRKLGTALRERGWTTDLKTSQRLTAWVGHGLVAGAAPTPF